MKTDLWDSSPSVRRRRRRRFCSSESLVEFERKTRARPKNFRKRKSLRNCCRFLKWCVWNLAVFEVKNKKKISCRWWSRVSSSRSRLGLKPPVGRTIPVCIQQMLKLRNVAKFSFGVCHLLGEGKNLLSWWWLSLLKSWARHNVRLRYDKCRIKGYFNKFLVNSKLNSSETTVHRPSNSTQNAL